MSAGLHVAAALGQGRMVDILIEAGANVSVKDNFGRTPLLEAVRALRVPEARALYACGAELGLAPVAPGPGDKEWGRNDIFAATELIEAAGQAASTLYLRLLLQFGAPPNATDYDRRTPAHAACARGKVEAVLVLLEYGADLALVNRWGRTPLDEAALAGHGAMLAVIESRKEWGDSLGHLAEPVPAAPRIAAGARSSLFLYLLRSVSPCVAQPAAGLALPALSDGSVPSFSFQSCRSRTCSVHLPGQQAGEGEAPQGLPRSAGGGGGAYLLPPCFRVLSCSAHAHLLSPPASHNATANVGPLPHVFLPSCSRRGSGGKRRSWRRENASARRRKPRAAASRRCAPQSPL